MPANGSTQVVCLWLPVKAQSFNQTQGEHWSRAHKRRKGVQAAWREATGGKPPPEAIRRAISDAGTQSRLSVSS